MITGEETGAEQASEQAEQAKKLLTNGIDPSVGKDTQFAPGVSGNPNGRPKGRKNLSTWIQEMLNDEEFEALLPHPTKGWKEFKGRPVEAIIKTAIIRSMNGDTKSMDWLAKYGYGTKIDVTSDGERVTLTPLVISDIAPRDDSAITAEVAE